MEQQQVIDDHKPDKILYFCSTEGWNDWQLMIGHAYYLQEIEGDNSYDYIIDFHHPPPGYYDEFDPAAPYDNELFAHFMVRTDFDGPGDDNDLEYISDGGFLCHHATSRKLFQS